MQESEIIRLIKERNADGAAYLLENYSPLMRYIIAPILNNPQDREDALSEASMRVWDKIELYNQARGSFKSWLTSVTRNTAVDIQRRINRNAEDSLSETEPSKAETPEENLLKREEREKLLNAIVALPAMEKEIFYRKYYYMHSTEKIAFELRISIRAVEGRLYRIKKKLRSVLGGDTE